MNAVPPDAGVYENLPLHGISVVEMTHMIMGPSCGFYLAMLGADVIKVEPPGGDKTRDLTGMGRGFFPTFNRAKRSVIVDIKTSEGREQLEMLLRDADVFVENFRDASLLDMRLDPDSLRARFPTLIVASCKGFLQGPYKDRAAMDEVVQMMTGMAYMTGPTGRPLRIGSSAVDIMGGLFAAFGVLAALWQRQTDGQGHTVRSGLFESCLLLVAQHMVQFDIEGVEAPPMPERTFAWPVYDIFETSDEQQLFVGAVTEGQWDELCKVLELNELLDDPRLKTRPDQIAARDWTIPIVAAAIAKRRHDDLTAELAPRGIPFSPIGRPAQMYDDPHVNRPGGLRASRLPEGGTFRAPGLPIELDGRIPWPDNVDLPKIGEHGD